MNIFITGINGFIANNLVNCLLEQETYSIYGSTSKPKSQIANKLVKHVYPLSFSDSIDGNMFQNIDVIIHCAHDFEWGALKKNIQGTIAIAEAARHQGVSKQIFISSLSARSDAITEYGKAKYEIERYFLQHQGIIVRSGTVLGMGGIFGKIVGLMKKFPALPLLDGGKSQMHLIGIMDLCKSISLILNREGPLEFNLYYSETHTLRTVLTLMKILLQRNVLLIPLPAVLFIWPLEALKRMGVRLPIDVDNLKGFAKSQKTIHHSDLKTIMESAISLESTLKESFM